MDLVRLACVKHAASVRPEPGSNSPSRSAPASRKDLVVERLVPWWGHSQLAQDRLLSVFCCTRFGRRGTLVVRRGVADAPALAFDFLCSVFKEHWFSENRVDGTRLKSRRCDAVLVRARTQRGWDLPVSPMAGEPGLGAASQPTVAARPCQGGLAARGAGSREARCKISPARAGGAAAVEGAAVVERRWGGGGGGAAVVEAFDTGRGGCMPRRLGAPVRGGRGRQGAGGRGRWGALGGVGCLPGQTARAQAKRAHRRSHFVLGARGWAACARFGSEGSSPRGRGPASASDRGRSPPRPPTPAGAPTPPASGPGRSATACRPPGTARSAR